MKAMCAQTGYMKPVHEIGKKKKSQGSTILASMTIYLTAHMIVFLQIDQI